MDLEFYYIYYKDIKFEISVELTLTDYLYSLNSFRSLQIKYLIGTFQIVLHDLSLNWNLTVSREYDYDEDLLLLRL